MAVSKRGQFVLASRSFVAGVTQTPPRVSRVIAPRANAGDLGDRRILAAARAADFVSRCTRSIQVTRYTHRDSSIGAKARALLAKGRSIDLHPRAFKPGDAGVTLLSHIAVQLWQVDETPTFDLALPRATAGLPTVSGTSALSRAFVVARQEFGMARKTKRKRKTLRRDAVSPFRDRLWDLFRQHAKGLDGADVVLALKQAGEEIWAVGIDDTYSHMSHQDDEPLGNAFDITWLTICCVKLVEIKHGKRPTTRTNGC